MGPLGRNRNETQQQKHDAHDFPFPLPFCNTTILAQRMHDVKPLFVKFVIPDRRGMRMEQRLLHDVGSEPL